MVQIQIDVTDEIDKQIEIYKAINGLANKAMTVENILKEYFKLNKMPEIKNGK